MKTLDTDLLEEVTCRLVDGFHPEQIILFGSHAWGTPNDDSDIDLFVIVSESDLSPTQRATRAYRALRGIRIEPTDSIVRTRAETERYRHVHASLASQILTQGRFLYG
ncbi:MAG: nucleotidyltransferase domain-containing protein [Chloroflexota bacterium]|nr:nucleotidyltransferase domain-containing protein [Chloroflexota bacterium]